jgi:hypothetical protein
MLEILSHIPFYFDFPQFCDRIHIDRYPESRPQVEELVDRSLTQIKPKAVYKICYIDARLDDAIKINPIEFHGKMLTKTLQNTERVFAYVATCGHELDEGQAAVDDFFVRFWFDTLKEMALECAISYLENHIKKQFSIPQLSSINPGSGEQEFWPIEQQKDLFALIGDVDTLIGVQLTDSCLMVPNKTVSGLFFASDHPFVTCEFCSRADCPRRRAPHNLSAPHN